MDFKSSLLPRAAALAFGTAGSLIQSAYRNYSVKVPRLDTRPPVSEMPRRVYGSRRTRRRTRRPMRMFRAPSQKVLSLMRTTSLVATKYFGIGSSLVTAVELPTLNLVKTNDLIAAFDLYRIRKVQVVVTPVFDPGNSGVVNNDQLTFCAACDPSTNVGIGTYIDIGAFENHRSAMLVSGKQFVYTFYPKAVNVVYDGSTTQPAGSYSMNPWLQCNAVGVTIPHQSLQMGSVTTKPPTVANTDGFQYYFRIFFDVKNIS